VGDAELLDYVGREDGGGRSLDRTPLQGIFPFTGIFSGNSAVSEGPSLRELTVSPRDLNPGHNPGDDGTGNNREKSGNLKWIAFASQSLRRKRSDAACRKTFKNFELVVAKTDLNSHYYIEANFRWVCDRFGRASAPHP
jgi:hypothetical protein